MTGISLPRLVVAGLAGDTGKSLISLGLIRAWARRGMRVAPFKKGPDFIDAAWLGAAASRPGRNLDTYLMRPRAVLRSIEAQAETSDIAVVEGNRGLFDGMDASGSHSSAALAKLLRAPVVLVVDVTKATRTVAAWVLGCQRLDPELDLAGVILNRVATPRHERVVREAIGLATGLPVLGALPKLSLELPGRHLGLVTVAESARREEILEAAAAAISRSVDLDALAAVARRAPALTPQGPGALSARRTPVRIGVLRDRAFSFYYPENLEALQQAGATLVDISPLDDETCPQIDALYAGGGFPEVFAGELSANAVMRTALAARIAEGLPVWAECGGLMYLSQTLRQAEVPYPMVGALPFSVEQLARPQGHGYVAARVDRDNPFLEPGLELRGHEFHYSRLDDAVAVERTALALQRGTGLGNGRDGFVAGRVMASYTHVHALGTPEWAPAFVAAAAGGRA